MRRLYLWFGLAICALGLGLPSMAASSAAFQIIVNEQNPIATAPRIEVSRMLLKKITRWDHGPNVDPVDLPEDSATRAAFSRRVHGRPSRGITSFWRRQIFSGSGTPPPERATDAEIVAFVREHEGGIGYVSPDTELRGVKVLALANEENRQ